MMRKQMLILAFLVGALTGWTAQDPAPIVKARTVLATNATHPGSTLEIAVVAQIAPGYHINDHQPTLDYLIPSTLKIETKPGIVLEGVNYPQGAPLKLAFSEKPISVYQGTLVVKADLKIALQIPFGVYILKGKFAYQACDNHECFPPTSAPVEMAIKVVSPSVHLKRVNDDALKRVKFE